MYWAFVSIENISLPAQPKTKRPRSLPCRFLKLGFIVFFSLDNLSHQWSFRRLSEMNRHEESMCPV